MGRVEFTKAQASGNDFIIIDRIGTRVDVAPEKMTGLAKDLCRRKWSIGADGLIVIEPSDAADFRFRIINPDGSEADMCGNGARCAALYASTRGIASGSMKFETGAGIIDAEVNGDIIKVRLTEPKDIKWNFCLMIHKCPYMVNFVNTGVPHVVHFVDDLESIDVAEIGSSIRFHEEFSPGGTNTDFVKVVGRNTIKVRTYERGVEDETHACGTGVVASALIAAESEKFQSPITVETWGGETLKVYFDRENERFSRVFLEGKAELLYSGTKDI
ncbi:MAG: diaminopimelate epimerase [Candidatus Omnitrophota bacterium]